MPGQITPTVLGRGVKNAAIAGTAFITVVGLGSYGLAASMDRSVGWAYGVVGAVSLILILTFFFLTWFRARARRGAIILDCGPHPTRWLFLLLAALIPLSAALSLSVVSSERSVWAFGGPALMLVTAPFYLALATGRLQVTELGLWQYWALLPWDKINSVQWADDSTLLIQAESRFRALGRGALPVPLEHRDAITRLLAQHGIAPTA